MSRTQNNLNVSQVKSLRQEGRYNDGAGLYLRVRKTDISLGFSVEVII